MSRILTQLQLQTASLHNLEQALEDHADFINGLIDCSYTHPAKPRTESSASLWRLNKSRVKRGLPRLEALPEQLQEKPAVDPRQVVEEICNLLGIEA